MPARLDSKLSTYRQKRDFEKTSEPGPSASASPSDESRFMVHKHHANRLHYDVRLESEGVLWSWACPKGPSYDPAEKRLAVETEDHPLAYGDFEGRIPDDEYGGGDSLVWDRGTFDTVPPGQAKQQRAKGRLHLRFHGEKLSGDWHLVRTRPQGGKAQWLLFKAKDGTERPGYDVVSERPESVLSGRSVTRGPTRKGTREQQLDVDRLLEKVWPPMLATLSEPGAAPQREFLYEVKYDGYRALAAISKGRVAVKSRNQLDFMTRFPFLARAFGSITVNSCVLDGEIVARDDEDRSRFQLMGDPSATHEFVAFDLLWLDGEDLRARPLEERRQLLESVLALAKPPLVLSQRVDGTAEQAMVVAGLKQWEGLIAKRRGSRYVGTRSQDWLKLKRVDTAELAIVGWTPHTNSSRAIGALLLASHVGDHYVFAGKVGTGFDAKTRAQLKDKLAPDEVKKPDVEGAPRLKKAHWVKPKLVAQVKYSEWTRDGKLRHPSFLGLRDDKTAPETNLEGDVPKGLFGTQVKPGFATWHSNRWRPRPSAPRSRGTRSPSRSTRAASR
jgi:bifunctional non-homologous end joining protein LigD